MYEAKRNGRAHYQFFSEELQQLMLEKHVISVSLREALKHEQMTLFYQMQVDLGSGVVQGVEALLRWRHPDLGWIRPERIVEIAEENGLIYDLGEWVLYTACAQGQKWRNQGLPTLPMSVNVSAKQFNHPDFVERVIEILLDTELSPELLTLELTESTLMADAPRTVYILRKLKAAGIKLAIDDFGTGYSSLSYLKKFPSDLIKIDSSFITSLVSDHDDQILVRSILSLAHSLNQGVVAEGVETLEQLEILSSYHCEKIQGS